MEDMTVVAIVDGTIFDSLIEFKSIIEQFDEKLKKVQFLHKDKIKQAKASGDFISAPLAFMVVPVESKEDYQKSLAEANEIRSMFEISVFELVFTAPVDNIFADTITSAKDLGCKLFDLVTSLHIIHENYEPQEKKMLKILSLISGLLSSDHKPDQIAFEQDYMTVKIKNNDENLGLVNQFLFEESCQNIEKINNEINELNTEIETLRAKESKKYEYRFSALSESPSDSAYRSVPRKTEELLDFCKSYASSLSRVFSNYSKDSTSDITQAQNILSKTFVRLCAKDEVDTERISISTFSETEPPYVSDDLIERSSDIRSPQIYKITGLIPLLRTIIDGGKITPQRTIKLVMILLASAILTACACLVPLLIQSGTAVITDPLIIAILGFIGLIPVAAGVSLTIDLINKGRIQGYMKNIISENQNFFSNSASSRQNLRKYINKYLTVSINNFVKTKKIEIALEKIENLRVQKQKEIEKADKTNEQLRIFTSFDVLETYGSSQYAELKDSGENLFKNVSVNDNSYTGCPKVLENAWLKEIAFETCCI